MFRVPISIEKLLDKGDDLPSLTEICLKDSIQLDDDDGSLHEIGLKN